MKDNQKESERYKLYLKLHPWMNSHRAARARCNDINNNRYYCYGFRKINFKLTSIETQKLWFRDKAYLMKKPSIDREDKDGDYTRDNCRFIELTENISRNFRKPIIQFDRNMNFIKEWKSQTEASIYLNIPFQSISQVCLGKKVHTHNLIFKFKD